MKRRLLALLCVFLMMAALPDAALAAPEQLYVNGVDILADPDRTVECGEGTVVYSLEEGKHTLTLTNATIDQDRYGNAIVTPTAASLTLRLVGENVIQGSNINIGVYCLGRLSILGTDDADLSIVCAQNGIMAHSLNIKDAQINMKLVGSSSNGLGFHAGLHDPDNANRFINSKVSIEGFNVGINLPGNHFWIQDSDINITGAEMGIAAGVGEGTSGAILSSDIDINASLHGITAGEDLELQACDDIRIAAQTGNGIYTAKDLIIDNTEVDARGGWPALYAGGNLSIAGTSRVTALAPASNAINAQGSLTVSGTAQVHAEGHGAYPAIYAKGAMSFGGHCVVDVIASNHRALRSVEDEILMSGGTVHLQSALPAVPPAAPFNTLTVSGGALSVTDALIGHLRLTGAGTADIQGSVIGDVHAAGTKSSTIHGNLIGNVTRGDNLRIKGDVKVGASPEHTVSLLTHPGGMITLSGAMVDGTIMAQAGSTLMLTAKAHVPHLPFLKWRVNGADAGTDKDPELTLVVAGDCAVQALFQLPPSPVIPVTGVTLSPESVALEIGDTAQLTAQVMPDDATDRRIDFATSDAAVTTVDAQGLVTAHAEGEATITATTVDGGFSATCRVSVVDTTGPLTLSADYLLLAVGEGAQLGVVSGLPKGMTPAWSAAGDAISVDGQGRVTALAPGRAEVVATVGEKTARCGVEVIGSASDVTGVRLNTRKLSVPLYGTDRATIDLTLILARAKAADGVTGGATIEAARFLDAKTAACFGLTVLDDRTLAVAPIPDVEIVGASYTSVIELTLRGGKTVATGKLTLTVARKLTLKASGKLDPLRPAGALVLTPSLKGLAERRLIITATDKKGRDKGDQTAQFAVTEASGAYELRRAEGGALNTNYTYTATLSAQGGGRELTAKHAFKVKPGKAKATLSAKAVTLDAGDPTSLSEIGISFADATLSPIDKVTLSSKAFALTKLGEGQWAIGFKDGVAARKGATVKLKVYLKGYDKPVTTLKLKVKLS